MNLKQVTGHLKSSEQRHVLEISSERLGFTSERSGSSENQGKNSHLKGINVLFLRDPSSFIKRTLLVAEKMCTPMTNRGKGVLYMVFVYFSWLILWYCFTFLVIFLCSAISASQTICCEGPVLFACLFYLTCPATNTFGIHTHEVQ